MSKPLDFDRAILATSRVPRPRRVRRVQALRHSSAAQPHVNRARVPRGSRSDRRRRAIHEDLGGPL